MALECHVERDRLSSMGAQSIEYEQPSQLALNFKDILRHLITIEKWLTRKGKFSDHYAGHKIKRPQMALKSFLEL